MLKGYLHGYANGSKKWMLRQLPHIPRVVLFEKLPFLFTTECIRDMILFTEWLDIERCCQVQQPYANEILLPCLTG
jgi:hypothetical protein